MASGAVVLLSITGPLAKHIELAGLTLGFHRFVWLAVALTIIMLVRGIRPSWKGLRLSWIPGVLFAANIAMFFTAIKLTTVANATMIGAIQPAIALVLVGPILGERVYRADIGLTVSAISGVVLVVYGSSTRPEWDVRGDLLSLVAILAWTGYLFATKRAREQIGTIELQATLTTVAALAVLPAALVSGQDFAVPKGSIWFLAVLALVGGTGHTLVNYAHAHTKLVMVSLMFLAVPVLSTAWAALFLDEPVNGWQVTGMATVVGSLGVLIYVMEHRNERDRELAATTSVGTSIGTSTGDAGSRSGFAGEEGITEDLE